MNARSLLCAVAVVFVATTAAAQTGICSGGMTDPFFAPQFGPGGVSIYWETQQYLLFSNSWLPVTSAGVVGHNINVSQTLPEIGPPQNWVPPACGTGSVLLGHLAPGTYNVTWTYRVALVIQPAATFNFVLTVPSDVPALDPRLIGVLTLMLAVIGVWILRR